VTGLTAWTLVPARARAARRRVDAAAAEAGVLVELSGAGHATEHEAGDTYDLAAITAYWIELSPDQRRDAVAEAFRVVRPGGRIVLVLATAKPRWPTRPKPVERERSDEAQAMLTAAGCRAVRVLGSVPGTTYVEGVKPRATAGT
jgi:hypothetical protein